MVTCTALDSCHGIGACNPSTRVCSNPLSPDGTPCAVSGMCVAGMCVPSPDSVDAGSDGALDGSPDSAAEGPAPESGAEAPVGDRPTEDGGGDPPPTEGSGEAGDSVAADAGDGGLSPDGAAGDVVPPRPDGANEAKADLGNLGPADSGSGCRCDLGDPATRLPPSLAVVLAAVALRSRFSTRRRRVLS